MILSVKNSSSETRSGGKTGLFLTVAVIIVLATLGAAVTAGSLSTGTTHYACLSVAEKGNVLTVTTSGLLHVSSSGDYISCNEGSALPTSATSVSCLTITPRSTIAPYPQSQTTIIYYLNAPTNSITVQGAGTNATEIFQPTSATVSVSC